MDEVYATLKGESKPCILNIEAVRLGEVSEKDILETWCMDCGAPAHIYHYEDGQMSFRSIPHKSGCPTQTKEGRQDEKLLVKKINIYTDTILNKALILHGNDRAPSPVKPLPGPGDESGEKENNGVESQDDSNGPLPANGDRDDDILMFDPDQLEKREMAIWYKFGIKTLSCIKSLFRGIKRVGYSFNMGDGLTAADYVLDDIALHTVRKTGFNGTKIAILKRCSPEDMRYLIKIGLLSHGKQNMDYIFLKDAYSTRIENAILFKIRCKNPEQNDHFKNLIMGSKKDSLKRDSRKYVVVFSFFKRIPNDYNQVYIADITYRQYGLFGNIEIGSSRNE